MERKSQRNDFIECETCGKQFGCYPTGHNPLVHDCKNGCGKTVCIDCETHAGICQPCAVALQIAEDVE